MTPKESLFQNVSSKEFLNMKIGLFHSQKEDFQNLSFQKDILTQTIKWSGSKCFSSGPLTIHGSLPSIQIS